MLIAYIFYMLLRFPKVPFFFELDFFDQVDFYFDKVDVCFIHLLDLNFIFCFLLCFFKDLFVFFVFVVFF